MQTVACLLALHCIKIPKHYLQILRLDIIAPFYAPKTYHPFYTKIYRQHFNNLFTQAVIKNNLLVDDALYVLCIFY